jgi:hypothetical protein
MTKFSVLDGIKSMLSGDYVANSWQKNTNATDLQSDIVNTNTNLALVGALVLTFAFPMFTSVSSDEVMTPLAALFAFFTATCGVLESVVVLLCIRNILVINLVEESNMDEYTKLAGDVMLLPTKLNFVAVLTMFLALVCFAFWQFYFLAVIVFAAFVLIPAVVVLVTSIGKGIRYFDAIQPWRKGDDAASTRRSSLIQQSAEFQEKAAAGKKSDVTSGFIFGGRRRSAMNKVVSTSSNN